MMSLIDDKGLAQAGKVHLIRAEQKKGIDRTRQHSCRVRSTIARYKAQIKAANSRSCPVQDVESVPVIADQAVQFRQSLCCSQYGSAVRPGKSPHADNQHRARSILQYTAEAVPSGRHAPQCLSASPKMIVAKPEITRLADKADLQLPSQPSLTDTCIEYRRFPARVATD